MKVAYSNRYIDEVKWRIAHARDQDNEVHAQDIIRRLKAQMFESLGLGKRGLASLEVLGIDRQSRSVISAN